MKKIQLILFGLCTLTACSEDAFQEVEKQKEESGLQNQTNSFNDNNSGTINSDGTKYPGDNYASPWDIWFNRGYNDKQPAYIITNGTVENISPFKLEVWAYAGLAYFDGTNDGIYNDPHAGTQFAINNGNYPKLFANNQEVGNLVRTSIPFTLNPQEAFRLEGSVNHLPMTGSGNKFPQVFNFGNNQLTTPEQNLLRDYGKVFFYEVNVFNAATNAFVGKYILHPEIQTLYPGSGAYWNPVQNQTGTQLKGFVQPLGGNFDLYYYDNPNIAQTQWLNIGTPGANQSDSFEVVFDVPPMYTHTITSGGATKTLSLYITQNPYTFWQNSSLDLVVY